MHDRVEALVGDVSAPAHRALEQRSCERGRSGQQPVARLVICAREQRLEELQRDAECELGLELRRPGAQHGDRAFSAAGHRGVQQRRLSDAGVALYEQQATDPVARGTQGLVNRVQLRLSLKEGALPHESCCHVRALGQKTGGPPTSAAPTAPRPDLPPACPPDSRSPACHVSTTRHPAPPGYRTQRR